jgi:predicted flap endonuclease-1-like 5' DNA nuclease
MGLLSKLKSLLGLGDDRPARRGNVDVTVEHEPGEAADAESERAVTEPASEPASTTTDAAPIEADDATGGTEPAADTSPEPGPREITAEPEEREADAGETEPEVEQVGPAAEPVDTIKGIGPSYAEKLESAGVETVGDLAAADADALGDDTGLSPKRISRWIEQAEARTG